MRALLPTLAIMVMAVTGCRFDQSGIPSSGASRDAAVTNDARAPAVDAGPVPITFGDGSDGDFVTSSAGEIVNAYTFLSTDTTAGTDTMVVADAHIVAVGDVVLVWQPTRVLDFVPISGSAAEIDLGELGVGGWELTRVTQIAGNALHITPPLHRDYSAVGAQVVRVPQYRSLTIPAGTSITARPWDGSLGGVVAVLVSGTITNDGAIDVDGLGFRGGAGGAANDSDRGEGIIPFDWNAHEPRRNMANAGGGGANHNAGGGGGGHMAAGGIGSHDYNDRAQTGGLGGVAVVYDPTRVWSFGGGGGSGHENNDKAGPGGAGGGVVFLRADTVTGSGNFTARGGDGASLGNDGSGGGGAGGLIYIRARGALRCGQADASGGDGGPAPGRHGTGGGGAPGRVELPTAGELACEPVSRWGVAGRRMNPSPFGPCHGARPCCGDGHVDGDEQCDDGNLDPGDGCNPACKLEQEPGPD